MHYMISFSLNNTPMALKLKVQPGRKIILDKENSILNRIPLLSVRPASKEFFLILPIKKKSMMLRSDFFVDHTFLTKK